MSESTTAQTTTSANLLFDIANAFVAIHKQFHGRGPTKARAHVGHDLVVVVLEGGFSRAEQALSRAALHKNRRHD